MEFEWDQRKEKANIQKHKVSFDEAKSVFFDDDAILISDSKHSEQEDRFILLGLSENIKELVVSYCERFKDGLGYSVRIISARKANKQEAKQYWERKTT